mmetsp:Transcript_7735/g.16138  ORF Transcript_7735/g.16138 Transcript_7735/m.16138 type:complete len:298 (-) Transcript_7735:7-900(-)
MARTRSAGTITATTMKTTVRGRSASRSRRRTEDDAPAPHRRSADEMRTPPRRRTRSSSRGRSPSRYKSQSLPSPPKAAAADSTSFSASMSPLQENLNALSMFGPALSVIYRYFVASSNPIPPLLSPLWLTSPPLLFILSTAVHAPFSVTYHRRQALGLDPSRLDNRYRILDQSFIHFCCLAYSYALSGSVAYLLALAPLNLYAVIRLWGGGKRSYGKPVQVKLNVCVQAYLLPILLRGDTENYCRAMLYGFACFALFMANRKLLGWGHTIFHLVATPYSLVLLEAAEKVEGSELWRR